jgi:hypothetical protein
MSDASVSTVRVKKLCAIRHGMAIANPTMVVLSASEIPAAII